MDLKASIQLLDSYVIYLLAFVPLLLMSCSDPQVSTTGTQPINILWIVLEDTSPLFSCYGETRIKTPHIDELAKNGIRYDQAIMPAPVCSPCRSSIITGLMSTTTGTHNHHSSRTPESAIHLPAHIQTIPELFKAAGYFTFNNGKDDYNFSYDRKSLYDQEYQEHPLYGKKGVHIDISTLRDKTPFFGQIQLSGGKEIFNSQFNNHVKTPVDRSKVNVPPYIANHPIMVEEYARHLDAIQVTDAKLGIIMQQLEDADLLRNTIVFFFSDHGMRLTRHKQFLYEGGLHVPLMIADFSKTKILESGSSTKTLVSGLDLGPSSLALAGIPIPNYIEGKNIFDKTAEDREYVISARDRCDFTIDRIRSVRTNDYKYIRNFMPDRPYTQTTYMDVSRVPFVGLMKQLHQEQKLDSIQSIFFQNVRPIHELYDLKEDPFELHNLAEHPDHSSTLQDHIDILNAWMSDTNDKGQYPEDEENLKLMLGIWGDYASNPEYDELRVKYPTLSGSQFDLKRSKWKKANR